jgi:hypothetical protein
MMPAMMTNRAFPTLSWLGLVVVAAATVRAGSADAPPVKVSITVEPTAIAAGSDVQAIFKLTPNAGIKLNKYPKIKVQISASAGLVADAEASMGNAAPPAADNLDANYYHGEVDPLAITLHVDPAATKGRHEVAAKLSYFYCVAASGYCAPAKVPVTIPVTIR